MSGVLIQFTPMLDYTAPSTCFWTDFVQCQEDCSDEVVQKTTASVFVPAVTGNAYQPYSRTCPPPAPAPSPAPASGTSGCYVTYLCMGPYGQQSFTYREGSAFTLPIGYSVIATTTACY